MPAKDNRNAGSSQRSAKLKAISLAVMSAAVFSSAQAAGLGKITVLSGLGQPLNAEIELNTVSREEANGLSVRLASVEAFRQANIEFNAALYNLRFAVEQRGGRSVVRITSPQPLNEPFVDVLLEVSGNNSKLVREYTFLLDPPELRKPQAAVAQGSADAASQAVRSAQAAAPRAEAQAQRAEPAARSAAAPARAARPAGAGARRAAAAGAGEGSADTQEVEVKRGDTLGRIAAEVKPDSVSLDQMLVALYRANPDAFVGNNMNRLRAGQILKVPDAGTASSISQSEAHGVIVAQAADFNSYRGKLAAQVAHAAPSSTGEAGQSAGGKITSRVEEQANPVSGAKDKLTVSRAGLTPGATATEDKLARDKAAADAAARVKDLEKNVSDLQKLLELKNKDMAERQQQASAKPGEAAKAAPVASASASASATPAASAAASADAASAIAAAPAAAPAASTPGAAAAGSQAASTPAPAGAVSATPPAAKPAAKRKLVPPPPPPPPSLMDEVMDNPLVLGAGAGVLGLLAALGLRFARKRRELKKTFSDSAILSDSELRTNSLFGATGGQSVDTSSVFNSSFTPSASQLDTNEVDPVAEADVYIAYGRDAQAEEILKEALRTQPERHAVRLKLLEIYASRKDLRAFDTVASELYSMTKGEGAEWAQALELGAAIDPKNPLYANAKGGQASAPTQPAASEELDLDALLNTTTAGVSDEDGENTLIFDDEPAAPAAAKAEDDAELPAAEAERGQAAAGKGATQEEAAAEDADSNLMEFTLPVEPEAAAPAVPELAAPAIPDLPPVAAPAAEAEGDGNTLDFDFDLSELGAKELLIPESSAASASPASPANSTSAQVPAVPELPTPVDAAPEIPAPVEAEAQAKEEPDFDFNFDLLKPVADKPLDLPAQAAEGSAALEEEELEEPLALPSLNAASPAPAEFDMGSINLDLGTPVPELPADTVTRGLPSQAEMATKLDLALAYQEIGDLEGARELLDEVMKGGNAEQVQKARDMLENLA